VASTDDAALPAERVSITVGVTGMATWAAATPLAMLSKHFDRLRLEPLARAAGSKA
jgi:hypothetical protein